MIKLLKYHMNLKTIFLYLFPIVVVLFSMPEDKSLLQMYGGISEDKNSIAYSIIEIMTWNLCVIPPVFSCYRVFNMEFSTVRFNTIIRSERIDSWWRTRTFFIVASNVGYTLLILLIDLLTNVGKNVPAAYITFGFVFSSHTLLLSYIMILAMLSKSKIQWSIIIYGMIEIVMVAWGITSSVSRMYLFPYWGMINNIVCSDTKGMTYLIAIEVISWLIIIILNIRIKKKILWI